MATIGQPLTAPETGWKRYDDTDSIIHYVGDTSSTNYFGAYNGSYKNMSPGQIGSTFFHFNFTGKKIRIISRINSHSSDLEVKIDGEHIGNFNTYGNNVNQALVFEKTDLEDGEHYIEVINRTQIVAVLDAIDIDATGELLPPTPPPIQVGDTLPQPEAGWKRYDDNHAALKYQGSWSSGANVNYYNGGRTLSSKNGDVVQFLFTGNSIRLIAAIAPKGDTSNSTQVDVTIDGVTESYNVVSESATATVFQAIMYEKTGLSDGPHLVTIENKQDKSMVIDAIDINEHATLLHPDEVTDPKALTIGKRIRAHYQAPSGQVGSFGHLGEEVYVDGSNDFIPPASAATPNGSFYYICVNEYNDKKIVVADRNIQHSVSWDELNKQGIASGSGVPIEFKNLIPPMRSDTNGTITLTSSKDTNTWKLFNGILLENAWSTTVKNPHITVDFGKVTELDGYSLFAGFDTTSQSVKSIQLFGSNVGEFTGEEILIDERTQLTWGPSSSTPQSKTFVLNNSVNFRYFRFVIPDNGQHTVRLDEIQLLKNKFEDISFTTRLLTGGETSEDAAHSEWDQYIVNGPVGSDNPIWNWSGIHSWTSTTNTNGSNRRSTRGGNTVLRHGNSLTNQSLSSIGFRPLLEIEVIPSPPVMKYLIEDEGEIKKYISSIEGDMIKEDAYTGEGTLLYIPVYKEAFIRVK